MPMDAGDRDALSELEISPGWRLVVDRVSAEAARRSAELEQPAEEARTNFLRGTIAGLRLLPTIPQILKGEIEAQAKE